MWVWEEKILVFKGQKKNCVFKLELYSATHQEKVNEE